MNIIKIPLPIKTKSKEIQNQKEVQKERNRNKYRINQKITFYKPLFTFKIASGLLIKYKQPKLTYERNNLKIRGIFFFLYNYVINLLFCLIY